MGIEYVRRNSHRKVDHHTAASSVKFFLPYGRILQVAFLKRTCLKQWSSGSAWSRYSWVELSTLIWTSQVCFSFFWRPTQKRKLYLSEDCVSVFFTPLHVHLVELQQPFIPWSSFEDCLIICPAQIWWRIHIHRRAKSRICRRSG